MKFIILSAANKDTELAAAQFERYEAGELPPSEEFVKMIAYQEELVKAGVLVGGEGLRPSSLGARMTFGKDGKTSIKDGPFTESKEIIAGFSILQVKSRDEALAWISRAPFPEGRLPRALALLMDETQRRIEAVFRIEFARLLAGLARFVRGDLGMAEELAQDALVAALETWPQDGIPREPGAWLMQVAKNRALKRIDRQKRWENKAIEITQAMEERQERVADAIEEAADDDVGDDLLRLVFASCHPSLSAESRTARARYRLRRAREASTVVRARRRPAMPPR